MGIQRKSTPFERSSAKFRTQPTLLVICEDSKSGKRYFEDAAQYFRIRVQVEIIFCGHTDPLGIVKEAISRERKFDRVYCAIDRDDHPSFSMAIDLAKTSKKVEIIASYPCFEYWYLLHFHKSRKSYRSAGGKSCGDRLVTDLRKIEGMMKYDKGANDNIFTELLLKLPDARKNSEAIFEEAKVDGNFNPSTTVHKLIADFEKMGQPEILKK